MKKIRFNKKIAAVVAAAVLSMSFAAPTYAYFDRGEVSVTLGASDISLTAGESTSVTVSFSPASDMEMPGCGMAECPQACGEKDCLRYDVHPELGDCHCNGDEYVSYPAHGDVSSSNTSVATASINGGVVNISAVSVGTCQITVTGSLRQYTSTSATINVTVDVAAEPTAAPTESPSNDSGNSGSSGSASSTGSGSSSGSKVSASKVKDKKSSSKSSDKTDTETKSDSSDDKTDDSKTTGVVDEKNITKVDSDRGTIWMIPAVDKENVEKYLAEVDKKEVYVEFQSKDKAENVIYAWEFYGKTLTSTKGTDLATNITTEAFKDCEVGKGGTSVYLSFSDDSELPGTASLYLSVSDYFENGDKLYAYQYDSGGKVVLLSDKLTVENGYVTIDKLTERGNIIITDKKYSDAEKKTVKSTDKKDTTTTSLEDTEEVVVISSSGQETEKANANFPVVPVVIIIIVAAAVVVAVVVVKKKNKNNNNNDNGTGTDK